MKESIFGYLLESFACLDFEWRHMEVFLGNKGTAPVDLLLAAGILIFLLVWMALRRRY